MKKLSIIGALFTFCLLISGLADAYEFSADTIFTSEGQKMTGKIFSKSDKSRMEMNTQGHQMIMISRMDKKVAWNIMPDQKMYMEMPIDPKKHSPKTEIKGEVERKQVGTGGCQYSCRLNLVMPLRNKGPLRGPFSVRG